MNAIKPLTIEETALKEEMKSRCLNKGQYIDEKAKDKFKMLCHLEDFEVQYWNLQSQLEQKEKQYCERTDCSGRIGNSKKVEELLKENNQLKDNWNKLKEWLEERKFVYNITGEDLDEDTSITEVLVKMQEIEGK